MRHLVSAFLLLLTTSLAFAEGQITVTGRGEVAAPPDMATVRVGVTTEADEAAGALDANSAAMAAVLARLETAGVEPRDVQTANLSLSPRWRVDTRPDPEITGFIASNEVVVRVRDLARLGEILDLLVADGANTLGGLSFGLAEQDALLDAARTEAVRDARRKAEHLAEAAGVALGPLVEMREDVQGGPVPMARMEMAMADAVPVAAGELGLVASVTMVFGIAE